MAETLPLTVEPRRWLCRRLLVAENAGGLDTVTLAHDALLQEWPALRDWLGADYLTLLQKGVDVWNTWRAKEPLITPNLSRANLAGADLQGADLHEANLDGANLAGANLQGADLLEANLDGANLRMANLRNARLRRADLKGAVLREANLIGADLSGADLGSLSWWTQISEMLI